MGRSSEQPYFEGALTAFEEIRSGRFCLRSSAAILDCLLDARCGILQVFKVHGGMELDVGIEGQKPRFRHGGDLRRILQVEEDEPGSLAIVCGKIRRLRLQIGEYGFDGLDKLPSLIVAFPVSTGED